MLVIVASRQDRPRTAREQLQRAGPPWSYHPGGAPAAEPTALAGLAVCAHESAAAAAHQAASWLARQQRPDGSVGVSAALPTPGWATSHALWLWSVLESHDESRRRAARGS